MIKIPIGIKSCFKNSFRQTSVKNTWLQCIDTNKFSPFFLVGQKNQPAILTNNTLYLDCDDSYSMLYTKTIAYFNWAYHNTNASHFWIVDDDNYINCKIFNDYSEYLNYDYSGSFIYGINKVNDNSGFTSGSGYCLSRNAVKILLDNIDQEIANWKTSNKNFYEDVLVGDTLNRCMTDIKKLHIDSIYPWSYCKYYKNLMIGHYVHVNSGLSFQDSMNKMHNLYIKNNNTDLLVSFEAKHIHWKGILSLYSDHSFYGGIQQPNGTWKIENNNLILEWYSWGKEVLIKNHQGYSNSKLSLIFSFLNQ